MILVEISAFDDDTKSFYQLVGRCISMPPISHVAITSLSYYFDWSDQ